ncbi:MAG TPA: alpha/beta fold hydrolase [Anaerolineaceae bacterium]|nr:alpha/beta fold hydrolase [Anaerolineaceae bacterium]
MSPHNNHIPFSKECENHSRVILYIHGVMGSPNEFSNLTGELNNFPIDYKAILLPGHGSTGKQFLNSNPHKWQSFVDHEVELLGKRYQQVFLIGHSLGGLLALNAASRFPISGIMLINTPLKTRITLRQIGLSLRVLVASKNSHDPLISTYQDSFSISMQDWWTMPGWVIRLADILLVAAKTRKILPDITTPVIIYQSLQDETVHPISADLLKKSLINSKVNLTYFQNSTHAYFEEKDRLLLVRGITQLINEPIRSS